MGHLVRAIDDGALLATGAQRAAAAEVHHSALAVDLRLERLLLAVTAELEAADVEYRVLKGPAVAHLVYSTPSLRSFGDIDLLVRGHDFDRTVSLLTAGGRARRRYPEPNPGFDRRFGKGVCLEHETGLEVDLHRAFTAGPFGLRMEPDELFATRSELVLGGRTLPALDPDGRFLHACFHASLGGRVPRVASLRDVAEMLLRRGHELDVDAIVARCERWRCGIVVQRAITSTWEAFGFSAEVPLSTWARWRTPIRWEQRALHRYLGDRRSYAGQAVAGAGAVRGLRGKAAYVRALLFPDRSYLHARDRSYTKRTLRGARVLIGRGPAVRRAPRR